MSSVMQTVNRKVAHFIPAPPVERLQIVVARPMAESCSAQITLHGNGRAVVWTSASPLGVGAVEAQARHAAERLGLPVGAVSFEHGDDGPCAHTAAAVIAACVRLEKELLAIVGRGSPLHGARAADVIAREGGLWLRRNLSLGEFYADILHCAARDTVAVDAMAPLFRSLPRA